MPLIIPDLSTQVQSNKADDLTAKVAGDLALAKIDLFSNNRVPTSLDTIGEYTIPVGMTGYAQKAIAAWTGQDPADDGSISIDATTVLSWAGPGDATGVTVFGYLIRAAAGGNALIAAVRFANPVQLMSPSDQLNLVPTYRMP